MHHFAGADAKGQRPKRTVRAGMAVAAHNRHARLGESLFRSDDVDDTLIFAAEFVERDAELGAVLFHLRQLRGGNRIGDGNQAVGAARCGGRAVIHCGDGAVRMAHFEAMFAQPGEGLR